MTDPTSTEARPAGERVNAAGGAAGADPTAAGAVRIGLYPNDPLVVAPHDPGCFAVADRVIGLVREVRPDLAPEHVGSSAVAGLPGKNVVDIAVLATPADIPAITTDLLGLGFQRQGGIDPWPATRPLLLGGIEHEGRRYAIHFHVTPDALEFRQLVALRDALRANPHLRDRYAERKQDIVESGVSDRRRYTYNKTAFLRQALADLGVARPPIHPPATIGILGGGQLGRMLGFAARGLGYRVAILDPDPECPARAVADHQEVAPYDDVEAALRLAARAAVVTIELEHIAPAVIDALQAAHVWTLRPGRNAIRQTQDRLAERRFLAGIGAPVAEWREVRALADLASAVREIGAPVRLKAALGGYDGRSQVRIGPDPTPDELARAFEPLRDHAGAHGLLVERELRFEAELSVVVARGADGTTLPYSVVHNVHDDGILVESAAPAAVDVAVARAAQDLAATMATELDLEGVLTVELFLLGDGSLAVNELAPRVHNSGHWTVEAARTSQFEQHIRAICGLPFGSADQHAPAALVNVLGEGPARAAQVEGLASALADPLVHVSLYDKRRVFERRKMGHVVATGASVDEALVRARRARAALSWRVTDPAGEGSGGRRAAKASTRVGLDER